MYMSVIEWAQKIAKHKLVVCFERQLELWQLALANQDHPPMFRFKFMHQHLRIIRGITL